MNPEHIDPSAPDMKLIKLIDDYNPNLKSWQDACGTEIKYLNGINRASTWKGIVLP